MYWWRSQLIPWFSGLKIEIYPFLSVQRAVSGQVSLVGERRGGSGGDGKPAEISCCCL